MGEEKKKLSKAVQALTKIIPKVDYDNNQKLIEKQENQQKKEG